MWRWRPQYRLDKFDVNSFNEKKEKGRLDNLSIPTAWREMEKATTDCSIKEEGFDYTFVQ